ncbi:PTS sugar transporter subunit IIC [Caproiciproducens sp.]
MEGTKVSKFEATMNRVSDFVERKIAPPMVKLGNNRYMMAIRGGLIRVIPLFIIGSIPLILTNLPVESWANAMKPFYDSLNTLFNMTFGFMSLWLALSIGAEMARIYKLDETMISIVSVACYMISASPINLKDGTVTVSAWGSNTMFLAFVVGIVVAEVMRLFRDHNWGIKLPGGVPENITASFASLIPMAVLFVFFWFLRVILGFELNKLLMMIVSPLMVATDTWWALALTLLILQLLWFVGIHGGSLTFWGVLYPFLISNISENAAAAAAGQALPHILTEPFIFTYCNVTGTAITLPLIIIWLSSKSVRLKKLSRLCLIPDIFGINEPILFGAPLIMNPLMFLPFVFGSTFLGGMYGYIITKLGWVTAPYIQVPWTTPILIQPYLATGGDWRAVVAQLILLVVVGLIWYPFAKVWERRCVEQEMASPADEKTL